MKAVNSHNEWGKLEEVIVGDGFPETLPALELTFQLFYHNNIHDETLSGRYFRNDCVIKKKHVEEMREDVEGFVDLLKSHGITVKRPKVPEKITVTNTPNWKSTNFHCLMTRDLVLIVGDKIIEMPVSVRYRYFETDYMKHIFMGYFLQGAKWFAAPRPLILDSSFDLDWLMEKDPDEETIKFYEQLKEKDPNPMGYGYEIMMDAANCMRFGKDILANYSNSNHAAGIMWLKSVLGHEYTIWTAELTDSHVDSTVVPLRPGLLLTCWKNQLKETALPKWLQSWDMVEAPIVDDPHAEYEDEDVMLASNAIDSNVLSIDENTVICHDVNYKHLQPVLKPYGIECIPCRMRHSRIFGGAFHCLTLDVRRQGELESYR